MTQAPTPGPLTFGAGKLVVDTGHYAGSPAVFICPAKVGGPVGASAQVENNPTDCLQPNETVLTFPTMEQAKSVADALVLAPTAPVETLGHAAAFAANIDTAPVEASGSGDLASAIAFMDKAGAMLGRGEMPAPGTPYAVEWYHAHATVLAALRSQPSGFLATLTDEQRTAALAHTGGDTHPQPSGETRADALRAAGWSVAVHNDYRLNGEAHTFWLWTHPDGRWIKGEGRTDEDALSQCATLIRPAPVAETAGEAVACWIDGAPSGFRAQEWFIAKTTYGDRVVLQALPDEYAYDFKTADETYIKRDKVAAWMPFPDSEFTPPVPAQDDDKLRIAVEALEPFAALATVGDQRPKDDAVWAGQGGKRITFGDFRRASEALAALKSTPAQEGRE